MRRVAALAGLLVGGGLALVGVGAGCSSPAALEGAGGTCEQATDCEEGLVCIPKGSGRVCSSNLSSIQHTEEAGADGAAAAPPPAGDSAAPPPPGDGGTPKETGTPEDTGSPGDAGGMKETGGQDTGGGGEGGGTDAPTG